MTTIETATATTTRSITVRHPDTRADVTLTIPASATIDFGYVRSQFDALVRTNGYAWAVVFLAENGLTYAAPHNSLLDAIPAFIAANNIR